MADIKIDHAAAKSNAQKVDEIADRVESARMSMRENAAETINQVFFGGADPKRTEIASRAIADKIATELESLDKIAKQLHDVADKMREISKTLEMAEGEGAGAVCSPSNPV